MAVSGTFARQAPTGQLDQAQQEDVPWLLVLSVMTSRGGFARKEVIAVATDKDDLRDFLERWIAHNRQLYAGQYFLDYVPFVSEVPDDA